ncbi:hypothetical protein TNCV_3096711, partial [Trichonephila clavipes]
MASHEATIRQRQSQSQIRDHDHLATTITESLGILTVAILN